MTLLSATVALGVIIFWLLFVVLAALGRSFGVTKLYIRILLFIFEWGKERIRLHEVSAGRDELTNYERQRGSAHTSHTGSVLEMSDAFHLADAMHFCRRGMEVIVEDTVTQRFDAAELPSWNLLTRSNTHYEFISWRLTFLWFIGCVLRLFILFPFRLTMFTFAVVVMTISTAVIGYIPDASIRRRCYSHLMVCCFRIVSRAFSAVITFHNRENRARGGGICVANHTSPIDIITLGCDNCYAMVGQAHGGFFGLIQKAMSRSEHHIWFQRAEVKDRLAVTQRLREHIEDKNTLPILIFPEGTCINNTSIMMFKKGSFEIGGTVYPAAIKYDSRFADAFWNSSKQTLLRHLLNIMTSWALVVDVWYLPPQHRRPDETVVEFTNRVKADIARQGGMVDLDWDGRLKREMLRPSTVREHQAQYARQIR